MLGLRAVQTDAGWLIMEGRQREVAVRWCPLGAPLPDDFAWVEGFTSWGAQGWLWFGRDTGTLRVLRVLWLVVTVDVLGRPAAIPFELPEAVP